MKSQDERSSTNERVPVIDGFSSVRWIGRGGDSTIYVAHQDALDREVAIKVVNLLDEREVRRFQREISLTVSLGRQHPNIVKVLDTRTLDDGRPAIVMDFYELGSTHDRLLREGPFPAEEVARIGAVIGDAVGFAHSQGILHRDVKPQNILMLPTSYLLADFGIARPDDAGHTGSLDRLSYRHASPEVLDGLPPTAADDLWSLGSTLFTLLAGRAPFGHDDPDEDTALAYLRRVRTGERRPFPDGTPPELVAIIERLLAPRREDRFSSAAAAVAQLNSLDRSAIEWSPYSTAADGVESTPAATSRPLADEVTPAPAAPRAADHDSLSEEELWAPDAAVPTSSSVSTSTPAASESSPRGKTPASLAGFSERSHETQGRPGSVVRDPESAVARSLAGVIPAPQAVPGDPDEVTALRPTGDRAEATDSADTGTSAAAKPEAEKPSRPKVRGRVIALAVAMLVASGVVTYLLLRSPDDKVTDASSQQTAGVTYPQGSAPATAKVNDPELAPLHLTDAVDGGKYTVTFAPPSVEGSSVHLTDVTDETKPLPISEPAKDITSITVVSSEYHGERCFRLVGVDPPGTRTGVSDRFCVSFP